MPARKKEMNVFLLFDSVLVRKSVKKILSARREIQLVGEARNALKALHDIRRLQPDAVIMHSQDRDRFGIDILRGIRTVSPASTVMMLKTRMYAHRGRKDAERAGPDIFLKSFAEWKHIPEILTETATD
jgi:DNA-binding NarL/FixJ family response regulator